MLHYYYILLDLLVNIFIYSLIITQPHPYIACKHSYHVSDLLSEKMSILLYFLTYISDVFMLQVIRGSQTFRR